MKITVKQEGGNLARYLEGKPELGERGLTEEVAGRKVEQLMARILAPERGSTGSEAK
jgi:hypothetical protein